MDAALNPSTPPHTACHRLLTAPTHVVAPAAAGERVLDLGCGDGAVTQKLVDAGCEVLGVDASPELLEAARQRGCDTYSVDVLGVGSLLSCAPLRCATRTATPRHRQASERAFLTTYDVAGSLTAATSLPLQAQCAAHGRPSAHIRTAVRCRVQPCCHALDEGPGRCDPGEKLSPTVANSSESKPHCATPSLVQQPALCHTNLWCRVVNMSLFSAFSCCQPIV